MADAVSEWVKDILNEVTLRERRTPYSIDDGPQIESNGWMQVRTYRDLEFAIKWLRECWAARAWQALEPSDREFWFMGVDGLRDTQSNSYCEWPACSGMMFGYALLDELLALAEADEEGYRLFIENSPRYKDDLDLALARRKQFRENKVRIDEADRERR